MADYPYTLVPNNLTKFFEHIKTAGVPTKVTQEYLIGAGFKSPNARPIISILKFIDFLDSSGMPTKKYETFRNTSTGPQILGQAIRSAYSELFNMYSNAQQKDTEALRNFFSTHSKAGERVLSAMVSTFQSLCSMASFDETEQVTSTTAPDKTRQPKSLAHREIESLTINIQLTLPATNDGKIYEEFFKAMKKHLLEGKE